MEQPSSTGTRPTPWTWAAPAAMALVAAVAIARFDSPLGSDIALFELRVRDVPAHLPLTGAFSRFGWDHPGPILAYVTAPFYRLLGWRGLLVAAGAVNVGFFVLATSLLRRVVTARRIVVVQVGVLAYYAGVGANRLVAPWNPYFTIMTLLALATAALLAWNGDLGSLVPGAIAATVAVQAHVTAAVPALGLSVLIVVALCRRRGVAAVLRTRAAPIAAGVAFVLWLPPLFDQFFRSGNLTSVVRFARSSAEPRISTGHAVRAWLHALGPEGMWRSKFGPLDDFGFTFADSIGPLAWLAPMAAIAAVAFAWRRRDGLALGLAAIVAVLCAGALIGILTIRGAAYPYLVEWVALAGTLLWSLVGWAVLDAVALLWRRTTAGDARWHATVRRHGRAVLIAAAVVALGLPAAVAAKERDREFYEDDAGVVPQLVAAVRPLLPADAARLCWSDPYFGTWAIGFTVGLERAGAHVNVPLLGEHIVGAHRLREVPGERSITVAAGPRAIEAISLMSDGELARVDPLSLTDRQRERALTATVQDALVVAGGGEADVKAVSLDSASDLRRLVDRWPAVRDLPETAELLGLRGDTPPVAVFDGCHLWLEDG